MKTLDQNRQQVINYLKKTSNHVFLNPKSTFKWGTDKPGHYEYDFDNGTYFKVFTRDDKWFYLKDNKIYSLDIDHYLKYYENNAKCVISNLLFLNNNMKSIRNTKFVQSKINI